MDRRIGKYSFFFFLFLLKVLGKPARDCNMPEPIYQATMTYTGVKEGSVVTYKCIPSCYKASGSFTRYCKYGTWHNDPPECKLLYDKKNDGRWKNKDPGYTIGNA